MMSWCTAENDRPDLAENSCFYLEWPCSAWLTLRKPKQSMFSFKVLLTQVNSTYIITNQVILSNSNKAITFGELCRDQSVILCRSGWIYSTDRPARICQTVRSGCLSDPLPRPATYLESSFSVIVAYFNFGITVKSNKHKHVGEQTHV